VNAPWKEVGRVRIGFAVILLGLIVLTVLAARWIEHKAVDLSRAEWQEEQTQ
jgi:hypothetical protein